MTEVGGAGGFVPGCSGVWGQGQGNRDWVPGSPSCRALLEGCAVPLPGAAPPTPPLLAPAAQAVALGS